MRGSWEGARNTQGWPEGGLTVILGLTCVFMTPYLLWYRDLDPLGAKLRGSEKSNIQVLTLWN